MITFVEYIATSKKALSEDRIHNSLTAREILDFGRDYFHYLNGYAKNLTPQAFQNDPSTPKLREILNIFLQQIVLEPSLFDASKVDIVHFMQLQCEKFPKNERLQALFNDYQELYGPIMITLLSSMQFTATTQEAFISSPDFEALLNLKETVKKHLLSLESSVHNRCILTSCTIDAFLLGKYCARRTHIPILSTEEIGFFKRVLETAAHYITGQDPFVAELEQRLDDWENLSPVSSRLNLIRNLGARPISQSELYSQTSSHRRSPQDEVKYNKNN